MGWMREDGQSNIVVHDNSTNGTWVYVSFALVLHPAPIFGPPTPHALKARAGAHAHAHILTYADQRRARPQGRIVHPARRERDCVRLADATQNPLENYRFIYRHLAPKELTRIDAHYDMAQELGRGTFATVMKAMAPNTGEWWAVKIIHTQKLRPSDNNYENDCSTGGSGRNGHRGPTTPRKNRERDRHVGKTFVVSARRPRQTKQVTGSVSFLSLILFSLGCVGGRTLT
jgi:hypothetical protein